VTGQERRDDVAQFMVKISFDGTRTTCEPKRLAVKPGDVVQWTSDDGSLAVDFGADVPFTSTQTWTAARGAATAKAIVKSDIPRGQEFQPTLEIDGAAVVYTQGVIVRDSP
jgi:plastocyanin